MGKEKNIQMLAENFIETRTQRDFNALFMRIKPGVLNHCYSYLKDFELAEDAFLNTMSKIWQKIDQYDSERGNFSTWCYNIARNESLLLIKSRIRYISKSAEEIEYVSSKEVDKNNTYEPDEDPLWEFLSGGSTVDDVYDKAVDEINALLPLYKDIMIDREIHGMKYKDIADKYGEKKRTIATRIRRARTKIKKTMEDAAKKANRNSSIKI